jgi:hypothetical protein
MSIQLRIIIVFKRALTLPQNHTRHLSFLDDGNDLDSQTWCSGVSQ